MTDIERPVRMNPFHPEYQYLDLMEKILIHGDEKPDETGKPELRSILGETHRYDLSQGFPVLTTKDVFWRGVKTELLWFLSGSSNIKYLVDRDVHIWDEWAYKRYQEAADDGSEPNLSQDDFIQRIREEEEFAMRWGDLGPVYGSQWRNWRASDGRVIDQVQWLLDSVRRSPYRKSYVVSAWNPEYIYEMAASVKTEMALPPCHVSHHVIVDSQDRLNLIMWQRSCDMFLGVPFNIASYALLTHMYAQVLGYKPGKFIHHMDDCHVYVDHFDQAREQLTRGPYPFPRLRLNPNVKEIDGFTLDDIKVVGYKHHPRIEAKIVVVGGRAKNQADTVLKNENSGNS